MSAFDPKQIEELQAKVALLQDTLDAMTRDESPAKAKTKKARREDARFKGSKPKGGLGANPKGARVKTLRAWLTERFLRENDETFLEVMRTDPTEISEWIEMHPMEKADAEAQADAEIQRILEQGKDMEKLIEDFAPSSLAPDREDEKPDPMARALQLLKPIEGIRQRLLRYGAGRPGKRKLAVAIAFMMALRPEKSIQALHEQFDKANPSLQWAFDYPEVTKLKTIRKTFCAALRWLPREVVLDASLDLYQELVMVRDDNGEFTEWVNDKAGRRLIVDGFWIPADELQRSLPLLYENEQLNKNRRMWARLRSYNGDIQLATDSGGKRTYHYSSKTVRGYLVVLIVDLDNGLPVTWRMAPANSYEPAMAQVMLMDLTTRAPWLMERVTELIGDSLYAHSKDLATWLYAQRIHSVFPARNWNSSDPLIAADGRPTCRHGDMDLVGPEYVPDKLKTYRDPKPPRVRWKCSRGVCDSVKTDPTEDFRVITFRPHCGDHLRVRERYAMLAMRNVVESTISVMRHLGFGRQRIRFGGDRETETLVGLAFVMLNGRRLAHESGLYDTVEEAWRELGLAECANPKVPNPGPDAKRLRDVTEKYDISLDVGDEYDHFGYYFGEADDDDPDLAA
jgi:hypothetical protein